VGKEVLVQPASAGHSSRRQKQRVSGNQADQAAQACSKEVTFHYLPPGVVQKWAQENPRQAVVFLAFGAAMFGFMVWALVSG
jgi:hypothetical protein